MAERSINPAKLRLSKWTALKPEHKEKHFLVTHLIRDEQETIVACVLEAVINHREYEMDWRELKNVEVWQMGWH